MSKTSKEVEKILSDIRKIKKVAPSIKRVALLPHQYNVLYEHYCSKLRIKNTLNIDNFDFEDINICRHTAAE